VTADKLGGTGRKTAPGSRLPTEAKLLRRPGLPVEAFAVFAQGTKPQGKRLKKTNEASQSRKPVAEAKCLTWHPFDRVNILAINVHAISIPPFTFGFDRAAHRSSLIAPPSPPTKNPASSIGLRMWVVRTWTLLISWAQCR
jgi:hypothetical protein